MRKEHRRFGRYIGDDQGFTLPELMIIIVLMGILAAIAIPSLFALVSSRNVTTAANQIAADIRLTHSNSINQLTDWRVIYRIDGTKIQACTTANTTLASCPTANRVSADYWLIKLSTTYTGTGTPVDVQRIPENLPSGTKISSSNLTADSSSAGVIAPGTVGTTRTIEINSDGTASAWSGPASGLLTVGAGPSSGGGGTQTVSIQRVTSKVSLD